MLTLIYIALVILFSVFVQSATGFGIALIAMPLLVSSVGLGIAAPLVALVALVNRAMMLVRYHADFQWSEVWRLVLASLIGIIFGSLIYDRVQGSPLVEPALGIILIVYALFTLANPHIPPIHSPWAAWGLGIASGIMSRVYNVGGPPAVVYGTAKRWSPAAFKGNMQAFGILSSIIVVAARIQNGEMTPEVMMFFLIVMPSTALGAFIAFWLDRYIQPEPFRKAVLILLIILGVSLML